MILSVGTETTFVAGVRVFSIRVGSADEPRSMRVTITLDGLIEWTFDEPGWRPLSLGVAFDQAYLWSARELIVLPTSLDADPAVTRVDEDLLLGFKLDAGWLLVCETSVRLTVGGHEWARLEVGDVIEHASWRDPVLLVRDALGNEHRISVEGDRLSAQSA